MLLRLDMSPSPAFPMQFGEFHKNAGSDRRKVRDKTGKTSCFFGESAKQTPPGGSGKPCLLIKSPSPRGASARGKNLLCSIQIRCLSDRRRASPQGRVSSPLRHERRSQISLLPKALRAGHTEGPMLFESAASAVHFQGKERCSALYSRRNICYNLITDHPLQKQKESEQ